MEGIAEEQDFSENLIATSILFLIAFFGMLFNILALLTVRMNPALNSSFGLLCLSHCIANIGVMIVFMFWVTPMNLRRSAITSGALGKMFGQMIMFFWEVCVYTHLVISINRLVAIALPHRAYLVFTKRCTFCLIALALLIAFCHVIPYFWVESCYVVFDTTLWLWMFAETTCGHVISYYTDLCTGCIVCAIKIVLDCITATKLRLNNRALAQGSIFLCGMISFYFICNLFTGRWAQFITITVSWECCHAVDGLVLLLFHFRPSYLRCKRDTRQQAVTRAWTNSHNT